MYSILIHQAMINTNKINIQGMMSFITTLWF
jgi:hypothetical protein